MSHWSCSRGSSTTRPREPARPRSNRVAARLVLTPLAEPYRSRALVPGSARHFSWLFAAERMRGPLLAMYALLAEWRALMDPATEAGVAQIKLAWWRDEIGRLGAGSPAHPITRYLAQLPGPVAGIAGPLAASVDAALAQVSGAPLERATDLAAHADALYGIPLLLAARLGGAPDEALRHCTAALAAAEYLARALESYGRDARAGRIPFPIEELLAAGIENADLTGDPPPRLLRYLAEVRRRCADYFSIAAAALPPGERPALRHLLVLAALGAKHLHGRRSSWGADFHLADLYNAWNAARRAAAGR